MQIYTFLNGERQAGEITTPSKNTHTHTRDIFRIYTENRRSPDGGRPLDALELPPLYTWRLKDLHSYVGDEALRSEAKLGVTPPGEPLE